MDKRTYDPKTIFIPVESPQGFFRTSDKEAYRRGKDGVIRRITPKKKKGRHGYHHNTR